MSLPSRWSKTGIASIPLLCKTMIDLNVISDLSLAELLSGLGLAGAAIAWLCRLTTLSLPSVPWQQASSAFAALSSHLSHRSHHTTTPRSAPTFRLTHSQPSFITHTPTIAVPRSTLTAARSLSSLVPRRSCTTQLSSLSLVSFSLASSPLFRTLSFSASLPHPLFPRHSSSFLLPTPAPRSVQQRHVQSVSPTSPRWTSAAH